MYSQHLRKASRRAHELSAAFGFELNVVYKGSRRNALERHAVAYRKLRLFRDRKGITRFHTLRHQHITAFAIAVERHTNKAGAVGVVLNRLKRGGNVVLIVHKNKLPVEALMACSLMPHRNAPIRIPSHMALASSRERLMRLPTGKNTLVGDGGHVTAGRRCGMVAFHNYPRSIFSPGLRKTIVFLKPGRTPRMPRRPMRRLDGTEMTFTLTGVTL